MRESLTCFMEGEAEIPKARGPVRGLAGNGLVGSPSAPP